jgi:putative ABC transport system permease protein
MIKLYFKQAWNLIRQEKLFSSIYIIGTGLSITVVMVLSIVFYVKMGNIYPETNRDRLLSVKYVGEYYDKKGMSSSWLSYQLMETCFYSLESAEAVTAIYNQFGENYVQPVGSREQLPVKVKYVDTAFWTVFPFRFTDGMPFTESDMQSGIHTAVIAESLAKRLFGHTAVIGEEVSLNFRSYRICGVVKDASFVTQSTYALLWIPYSVFPDYKKGSMGRGSSLGRFQAYILAPSVKEVDKVRQEALDNIHRYAQTLENIEFDAYGQPDRQWQSILRPGNTRGFNFTGELVRYGLIFFMLLLIPAVSLSGMTDSRMERRLAEIGIRRTFGAQTNTLMNQILVENFMFTLLGGGIGLLVSYLFILLNSQWILQLGGMNTYQYANAGVDIIFTPAMLLNIPVFCIALLICFVLNLLSALIPAWRASRREIIYSLTSKS